MKLMSTEFGEGDDIPSKFTCDGEDINPTLEWSEIPKNVKSFALIVDDPDAPGKTWRHWILVDIPKDVTKIDENSVVGRQIANDFEQEKYGGPCPPSGKHRYFFRLYALDVESLGTVDKDTVYGLVDKHRIDEAVLMGVYSRS